MTNFGAMKILNLSKSLFMQPVPKELNSIEENDGDRCNIEDNNLRE